MFQCYQASLNDQFVFLQQSWINNETVPDPGTGHDPVIGPAGPATVPAGRQPASLTFQNFVRTEGSLFTLTPSIAEATDLGSESTASAPA